MTDQKLTRWHFRPSGLADLPLVQEVCASIAGEQGDYVPYSWPEWAADDRNQLFLVEAEGRPAGLYCLRIGLAGPGSGWIQGVRVAAAFQRQGLAAEIVRHAVKTSRQQGLTVLRYATNEANTPMHRIAARFNFRHVGSYLSQIGQRKNLSPVTTGLSYRLVTTSEFDGAYYQIVNSAEYRATDGFYCDGWWWKPLSIENLRQHIERREVFSLTGALKTLAIFTRYDEDSYWLSFLTGEQAASQQLLAHLVKKGLAYTPPDHDHIMTALLPDTNFSRTLLEQAHFVPDAEEPVFWLYQLPLVTQMTGHSE